MRTILLSLIFLYTLFLPAKNNNSSFFAKISIENNKTDIIEGDSAVFSVWLYSALPFGDIKCSNSDIKINHCHVKKFINRYTRNQTQRYIGNKAYYCYLWAQYVVKSDKKGNYVFPSLDFSITQYQEIEQNIDPFDPFGFFRKPSYKKISQNASSPIVKFNVITRPLKTTEELIKNGATII